MVTTLTVDKAGRIVLPKPVRDELELKPGDSLELESSEDGVILRPLRTAPRIYKKHGMWMLNTGKALTASVVRDTINKVRRERERRFLGKFR